MLSAASNSGSTSRSYSGPVQSITSPMVLAPGAAASAAPAPDSRARACPARGGCRSKIHHGKRPSLSAQRPALAAGEIDEGKARARRAGQAVASAPIAAQIAERGVVAGQQEMIAVVDRHAERGVVIGAAAAAGLRASPRARTTRSPLAASRTAAARPASPAPMTWTVRAIT